MSIFTSIRQLFTPRKSFVWNRGSSPVIQETRHLYRRTVGEGLQSDVFMAPVLWAARRMAECPIGLHKEDETELDFAHDATRLMKRPNDFYPGSALVKALAIEYLGDGNAYCLKIRNRMRKPIALWFIPHWCMEPHIPNAQGYIDYYEYSPGGLMGRGNYGTFPLPVEDVIHIRNGIDPENIRKGMSPLRILLGEIYTDTEAAMFTALLLKNGGVPGVIISPADPNAQFTDEENQKEKFKERFKDMSRGEPMIMKKATKVEYFGLDPAKLDLSRLRDVSEERVCALLGIPAAVVGFGSGLEQTKVGATMSEMRAMAYEDCIIPMQNEFCDSWDLQMLPDFEESPELFRLIFDLSNVRVLRDDEGKKTDRILKRLQATEITLFEARTALGDQAKPEHKVWYLGPYTMVVPEGSLAAQTTPPEPGASGTSPKGIAAAGLLSQTKAAHRASPQQGRLFRTLHAHWQELSTKWGARLQRKFNAYGDAAAQAFERLAQSHGKAEPDWTRLGELAADQLEKLDLDYGPQFLAIAHDTFDIVNTVLQLGVNLQAPAESRILSAGGRRMGLVDVPRQTRDAIFRAIEEGRAEGEGAAELASRIRDMVARGPWSSSEMRSTVIARTETKYAQNISSLEAYAGSENITGIEVFDAQLGPTDEECEMLNGQIVSVDEARLLADTEHPNGTRSFAPVVG